MALVCDICGGKLCIEEGGDAVCESCGMTHSSNRMKEKIQEIKGTVSIEGNVKTEKADFEIVAGKLVKYHGADVDVIIPNGVTVIGDEVFRGMETIRSVVIPESVIEIRNLAFEKCKSLTHVKIPESITKIGGGVFFDAGLKDIELSQNIKSIGGSFVGGCPIISFVVPNGITKIGATFFYECTKLKNVRIPDSVTEIEDSAFGYCKSLTEISLPPNVKKIGQSAFSDCTSLTKINIPRGVTDIDQFAFTNCTALTEIIIPGSVTEIPRLAFKGCTSLTNVAIQDGTVTIRESAFENCESLEQIIIPKSVNRIEKSAFKNCRSLVKIVIPDSVKSIGERAFWGCKGLTDVRLPNAMYNAGKLNLPGNVYGSFAGTDKRDKIDSPWFDKADEFSHRKRGCYIATAIYGSYDCPEVWTLRRYRDDTLAGTWFGRMFISVYYAISPTLVKWFGDTSWFKKMWRGPLDRMVAKLNESGVENTPYEDKKSWRERNGVSM